MNMEITTTKEQFSLSGVELKLEKKKFVFIKRKKRREGELEEQIRSNLIMRHHKITWTRECVVGGDDGGSSSIDSGTDRE